MMYYGILASFCLLGMARSQDITSLTACLTKDQNLQMECKYTLTKQTNTTCTYEVDKKVVASTASNKPQEDVYKGRTTITLDSTKCVLTLKGFSDDSPKMYNCTIQQEKSVTKGLSVGKKTTNLCSAGNTLKHGGVILLLAFVLPLLSGML